MKRETLGFNAKIVPTKPLNEELTLCKCYVLALGKNRNYSHISKEAADNAVPTIYNIPVVGHMYMDEENGELHMGGHDTVLVRDEDNRLKFKSLCVPFGVVPQQEGIHYEEVIDSKGNKVTYQVADIILWTGRYPELYEAIYSDDIYFGQSMEINVKAFEPLDEDKSYNNIKEFEYSALCLLGKSDDPDYHVEPCFPDSRVEPYHFEANSEKFSELMLEFKSELNECFQAINKEKGGEKRLTSEVCNSVLAEFGLKQEELDFEVTETMTEEELREKLAAFNQGEKVEPTTETPVEEFTEESVEEPAEEPEVKEELPAEESAEEITDVESTPEDVEPAEEVIPAEVVEDSDPEPSTDNFSKSDETLSYNQKMEIIREAVINLYQYENGNGVDYYLNDCDDTFAYLTEVKFGDEYAERRCRVAYTIEDNKASFNGEFETMFIKWLTQAEVEELETKRAEYEELKSFKMERLEDDRIKEYNAVVSEFSDLAEFEEFQKLAENIKSFESADALREKCYAIRGKSMVVQTTKKSEMFSVPIERKNETPEVYGGFFSKYPPKSGLKK